MAITQQAKSTAAAKKTVETVISNPNIPDELEIYFNGVEYKATRNATLTHKGANHCPQSVINCALLSVTNALLICHQLFILTL